MQILLNEKKNFWSIDLRCAMGFLQLETFGGKLQHISIAAATGYAPDGPGKNRTIPEHPQVCTPAPLCGFAIQCRVKNWPHIFVWANEWYFCSWQPYSREISSLRRTLHITWWISFLSDKPASQLLFWTSR